MGPAGWGLSRPHRAPSSGGSDPGWRNPVVQICLLWAEMRVQGVGSSGPGHPIAKAGYFLPMMPQEAQDVPPRSPFVVKQVRLAHGPGTGRGPTKPRGLQHEVPPTHSPTQPRAHSRCSANARSVHRPLRSAAFTEHLIRGEDGDLEAVSTSPASTPGFGLHKPQPQHGRWGEWARPSRTRSHSQAPRQLRQGSWAEQPQVPGWHWARGAQSRNQGSCRLWPEPSRGLRQGCSPSLCLHPSLPAGPGGDAGGLPRSEELWTWLDSWGQPSTGCHLSAAGQASARTPGQRWGG